MAQPIPFTPTPGHAPDSADRLADALEKHNDAIVSALDVLQLLHDRGVLDVVRGGLGASDQIVETVVDAAKTPEAIRGIRNLMVLARTMGTLEPKLLEGFFVAFHEALTTTKVQPQPPSLWHILNQFRSLQMRRGLMLVNSLLEALGRNLPVEKNS